MKIMASGPITSWELRLEMDKKKSPVRNEMKVDWTQKRERLYYYC